jgi:hypothetical protein
MSISADGGDGLADLLLSCVSDIVSVRILKMVNFY